VNMMKQDSVEKISELKKMILTLSWDINNIKNESLRSVRKYELEKYQKELEILTQQVGV
jgi:hypothetical protein